MQMGVFCDGCKVEHTIDASKVLDPKNLNVLKRCSNCFLVYYCNADCQRRHWKEHKPDCIPITKMRSSLEASKKTDSKITTDEQCSVCLDEMKSPVTLSCHHSFCRECLDQYQKYNPIARCPNCRADFPLDVLLHNASMLTQRARNNPEGSEARSELLDKALADLDKIIVEKGEFWSRLKQWAESDLPESEFFQDDPPDINEDDPRFMEKRRKDLQKIQHDQTVLFSARLLKSEALFLRGDFDGAVESSSAMLEAKLVPSTLTAVHLHIAQCRAAQGRHSDAVAAYQEAMRTIPQSDSKRMRELLTGCALALAEIGNLESAQLAAENAISMNRYYPGAYDPLVVVARRVGDAAAAVVAAQRAVLYETPWDDDNRATVVARAASCLREWSELTAQ